MLKVMVFGVFDGLHQGHRALLKEAKTYGEYLIVVVAQNAIVQQLKGHAPKYDVAERLAHLEMEDGVDEVVIGDAKLSSWEVVDKYQPDILVFGYDQMIMKEDFEKNLDKLRVKPELKVASSFEPNKYHSSIINK
jgi:FAD synthetase